MNACEVLVMQMPRAPTSQAHMYADVTFSSLAMASIA